MSISLRTGSGAFLLTVLLVILKLTHTVDWSWFWVLAPMLWPFYILYYLFIAAFWIVIAIAVVAILCGLALRLLDR